MWRYIVKTSRSQHDKEKGHQHTAKTENYSMIHIFLLVVYIILFQFSFILCNTKMKKENMSNKNEEL